MPKRKALASDYTSDSAEAESSSSYEVRPAPTRRKPTKQKMVKRGPRQRDSDAEEDSGEPRQKSAAKLELTMHPASLHIISDAAAIRTSLLSWYYRIHEDRGMPWRKPYNPDFGPEERAQRAYEVWISEIMLQQTQVTTVIPYYNKWMASFPTIKHLAEADIETVNALWKGLGYYSRAARLLAGAKKAVAELGGRLPDNAKDMQAKIPGIGRYSAGAICSIAYNEQAPVLDGNVNRLMSRVLALHAPPKSKSTLDVLWASAEAMVKGADRSGDVNQALIELGSTVCKPRDPSCGDCPLKNWCRAWQQSQNLRLTKDTDVPDIEEMCTICEPPPEDIDGGVSVTSYPMKVERKKQREELDVVSVVEWQHEHDRWFLLVRRPETGLLAGLHEFPTSPNVPTTISPDDVKAIPRSFLSSLLKTSRPDKHSDEPQSAALRIVKSQRAGDVLHVFSHIRKTYRVQWVLLEGGGSEPPDLSTWVPPSDPILAKSKRKKVVKAPAGKRRKAVPPDSEDEEVALASELLRCRWVRLEEVSDANIGTGVAKQWSLVRSLWDNP